MHRTAGPYAARVLECTMAARDICRLAVQMPRQILLPARPGQFADFLVPGDPGYHQLRRPLSAARILPEEETAVFYFRLAGEGTRRLARQHPGEEVNLLFPLGNGYTAPAREEKVWLVGGGTGAASIFCLPGFYGADFQLFLGFRNRAGVFGPAELLRNARIALDEDGILVTDLVREALAGEHPDRIMACGPMAMYRTLASLAADIPVEVSLEEHMGCGTGGCEACVVRIRGELRRTCVEGPVFALREVDEIAL